MTRVLVVAASAVVRAGLEAILRAASTIEVSGSAGSVLDLASEIDVARPDVVLLELDRTVDAPHPDFLPLRGPAAASPLVVLLDNLDKTSVVKLMRVGARAVLPRDAAGEEIIAAVEAAAVGLLVVPGDASEALLAMVLGTNQSRIPVTEPSALVESLTPREVEVLGMLAEGEGNKMIARRLGISEHTVKFHVGSILAKLNAATRTEAVAIGVREGLIML